ncbi:MAG: YibE/F family protein [Patescibacteria group bacterium]
MPIRLGAALLAGFCVALLWAGAARAQETEEVFVEDSLGQPVAAETLVVPDEYVVAKVVAIPDQGMTELGGVPQPYQEVELEITRGPEKGKRITVAHGGEITIRDYQKVTVGERVVLLKNVGVDGEVAYYIADHYRLPSLAWVVAIFFGLVVFFGRWRGFTSIIGIAVSIVVLASFIIPRILNGSSPLGMSLVGAVIIAVISLYVAHGFNRRTSIALGSTLITLGLAAGLALLFVSLAKLSGVGTEEAFYLQFGALENLNLKGLLLGGIIIGALGVLDDITTGQTAAVAQIHEANPDLSRRELVRRGLVVGREHIASLVNTLVLAYAGAAFPLLLLFSMNTEVPLWTTLNSEMVAEEVIRTLVGSSALVLAVPIATLLAAKFIVRGKNTTTPSNGERVEDLH